MKAAGRSPAVRHRPKLNRFEHACPWEGAVRKAAEADSNINQTMNEGIIRVKSCNLVISFLLETHVEQAGNELKKK